MTLSCKFYRRIIFSKKSTKKR